MPSASRWGFEHRQEEKGGAFLAVQLLLDVPGVTLGLPRGSASHRLPGGPHLSTVLLWVGVLRLEGAERRVHS